MDRTERLAFVVLALAVGVIIIGICHFSGLLSIQLSDQKHFGFSTGQEERPDPREMLRTEIQQLRDEWQREMYMEFNPYHDFLTMVEYHLDEADDILDYEEKYWDVLLPESRERTFRMARRACDQAADLMTANGAVRNYNWMTTPMPLHREN